MTAEGHHPKLEAGGRQSAPTRAVRVRSCRPHEAASREEVSLARAVPQRGYTARSSRPPEAAAPWQGAPGHLRWRRRGQGPRHRRLNGQGLKGGAQPRSPHPNRQRRRICIGADGGASSTPTADPAMGGPNPARRRPDPAPTAGGGEARRGCRAGGRRRWRERGEAWVAGAEPTSAWPWAAATARTVAGIVGGPGWGGGRRCGCPPSRPRERTRDRGV